MKNIAVLFTLLFVGWSASASSTDNSSTYPFNNYGESFIFVEGGVEFAIYPNGEFDFYYDSQYSRNSAYISAPNGNVSYNSGYNYDPYVQYDDYGAVIQIENVPVYYDFYGRIIQAGNIFIDYNRHGNISRLGGLRIQYNSFQRPVHYSGYINAYNSRYVYQPWHKYYTRPHNSYRVVYYEPYRAYYEPIRVNYVQYNTYYNSNTYHPKKKNDYYRPGHSNVAYNNGRRTSEIRSISSSGRSSASEGRNNNTLSARSNRDVSRNVLMERSSNPRDISRKEISNNERHEAAVRSNRNSTGVATETTRSSSVGRIISRDSRSTSARSNNDTSRQQETRTVSRIPQNNGNNASTARTSSPTRTVTAQRGRATNSSSRTATSTQTQNNNRNESVKEVKNTENSRSGRSSSSRDDSRI